MARDPKFDIEEGRAYDEHGNVRPADARWTNDKAVVERAKQDGVDVPKGGKPLVKETVQKGPVVKPEEPVPAKLLGTNPTAK